MNSSSIGTWASSRLRAKPAWMSPKNVGVLSVNEILDLANLFGGQGLRM